jgi:hypothetical protein
MWMRMRRTLTTTRMTAFHHRRCCLRLRLRLRRLLLAAEAARLRRPCLFLQLVYLG